MITATYRLQLNAGFRFEDARAIVDYLHDLGVSHVYASPYFAAVPGSTHGYDLADPRVLNPEIGTEEELFALADALAARGMGHIVDVVPNHMSASEHNAWWTDVLENGPSSLYADHFDVEWHPPKTALENKVLLPILGAQYGDVLERGELVVARDGGAFVLRYWDHTLPLNPRSIGPLLARAAERVALPEDDPRRQDLESVAAGLRNMPERTETDPERQRERAREKEVLKRRVATLCDDAEIRAAIDAEVALLNGKAGDPSSFDELDRVLLDQNYRLAYWRVATEEINYRRFFDINELAAVRMECDAVFDAAHSLVVRYLDEGRLDGVRLDHTDGLYDPAEYFAKLRRATRRDVYVVAEKILSAGEKLPSSWPIDGTTGYDFLVQASGVFVERASEPAFTRLWREIASDPRSFAEHARDAKRAIMRSSLSSEVHMLATQLERIAMRDRRSRDYTFTVLRRAISETIAAFPVYRTYVRPNGEREPTDERIVQHAIRVAKRQNPEISPAAFDFLRDVVLLARDPNDEADGEARVQLAMRFQQLTGPVTAKGVEDTAFYTYLRFAALNEVGGAPDRFGTTIDELHAANAARRERWPRTMLATSTHDTKRGEDVRARLAVLSEMPEAWEAWARAWLARVERHAGTLDDEPAPSLADRYLLLQTLVGAWPMDGRLPDDFAARITAYAVKAAREAKQRTSWLSSNDAYEDALRAFVGAVLGDRDLVADMAAKIAAITPHGASNGLALVTLKIASPGVTDTYQGSELWDLRLVDPDNRAPVDFAARRAALGAIEGARAGELLRAYTDGRIKAFVLSRGLRLRRARPRVFLEGEYRPIAADDDVLAFARTHETGDVVCAVVRAPFRVTRGRPSWAVGEAWGSRAVPLPPGRWRDVYSGREHAGERARLCDVFAELPVALLVRDDA